jgi:hypothetical protein
MKTMLVVFLVGALVAGLIFLALCYFFPDWFDTWAGDE